MKFNSAQAVIKHLYSLPKLHAKNDLSYIKRLLHQLGDPQNKVKTIHVTGTNGKGSTSYYLSNLLQKAGQKTGLFVSPYIREFNERIQLNSKNIPDDALVSLSNEIEAAIQVLQKDEPDFNLVTFEYETVLAFLYFASQKCDYAVIEVGIGAKHDKTNVIIPEVSVITSIGLDHEQIIGPTIFDIAKEKSGIIKEGRPVVLGKIPSEVLEQVLTVATEKHAQTLLLGRDFQVESGQAINYKYQNYQFTFDLRPPVESWDIAISLTVFKELNLPLAPAQIQKAINETKIPGRYQVVSQKPRIILDGAHNQQAMKNLLDFVKKTQIKTGKIYLLVAMMKDKDIEQVFDNFSGLEVVLTTIDYPRAAKKIDFERVLTQNYSYQADCFKAYKALKTKLKKEDTLLVTGSFYLVSAILNKEQA